MKHEIRGVIFDVGGVLVGRFGRPFIRNAAKVLGVSQARLRGVLHRRGEYDKIQTGKESSTAFWRRICAKLGVVCPPDHILRMLWLTPYARDMKPIPEAMKIVRQVQKRFSTGIISNTIREHVEVLSFRGLYDGFDAVILSSEIGCQKPERKIFKLASEKLDIPLKNLLFIDDELSFVRAARNAGMRAIWLPKQGQLKKKLKALKLL